MAVDPRAAATDRFSVQIDLGRQLERVGRLNDAIAAYRRSVALRPGSSQARVLLGQVLLRSGRLDEAIDVLAAARADNPLDANCHRLMAVVLETFGRLDEAADVAAEAVNLDPADQTSLAILAAILGRGGRFDEAVHVHRKRVSRAPGDPAVAGALGAAIALTGRHAEALETLDYAEQLGDIGAYARDVRGELLVAAGRSGDAIQAEIDAIAEFRATLSAARDGKKSLAPNAILTALAQAAAEWWIDHQMQVPGTGIGQPHVLPAATDGPLLSVVIPVHAAREEWLRQAIESALEQCPDDGQAEILVLDDASPDDRARAISECYPRVQYKRNDQRLGLVGNHNLAISAAAGRFIYILHQDDYIGSGFFERLLFPLIEDDRLVAGLSSVFFLKEAIGLRRQGLERPDRGRVRGFQERLAIRQRVQFCSIIVRRAAYEKVGGFSPDHPHAFDWDMWGRIAAEGPIWFDPAAVSTFRIHKESATSAMTLTSCVTDTMSVSAKLRSVMPADVQRAVGLLALKIQFADGWRDLLQDGEDPQDPVSLVRLLCKPWCVDPGEVVQVLRSAINQNIVDRRAIRLLAVLFDLVRRP